MPRTRPIRTIDQLARRIRRKRSMTLRDSKEISAWLIWRQLPPDIFDDGISVLSNCPSHPTVKPVQMVLDAILDCTARGEIVLDPFLGSGSTLIAAERAGRRCFGLDIDPKYVDVAIRRWQHPRFNSSLDQDELILKKYVHVGFAVDTLEGLVVPVIRDCDKKGLLEIATEMRALADRAIEGKLSADDMRADAFRFRLSAASADIVLRR